MSKFSEHSRVGIASDVQVEAAGRQPVRRPYAKVGQGIGAFGFWLSTMIPKMSSLKVIKAADLGRISELTNIVEMKEVVIYKGARP